MTVARMKRCALCGQLVPELLYDLHRSVDGMIVSHIKQDFPQWSEQDGVCQPCLERYRAVSVTKMKRCPLCGQFVPELLYELHRSVDDLVVGRMKRDFPEWTETDGVCGPCLARYNGVRTMAATGVRFSAAAISSVWIPR